MLYNLPLIITVFLGLVAGYFLTIISAEEIRPGYNYLVIMQNVLFSLLLAIGISHLAAGHLVPVVVYAISIIVPAAVFYLMQYKDIVSRLYIFTGIFLWPADGPYLAFASAAIFLLGLPVAAILAYDHVRTEKKGRVSYYFIKDKKGLFKHMICRFVWFIPIAVLGVIFRVFFSTISLF
ncbi:hypothetical protein JXB31_04915 [Candidatus Woesearchaeota archaeon]|nr:hypothetical protein [Candidatus Woesearchaeota archaeon]